MNKLFKNVLNGFLSAGYKTIGGWIFKAVIVGGIALNTCTNNKQDTKINKIANPAKEYFNKITIEDRLYPQIKQTIANCETEGMFVGFFAVSDGVGKFLGLQGKWDIISGLSQQAKDYVHNPTLIADPACRSIAITLNAANEYLSFDNTKYKNNIYLEEFTTTSMPCKIDEELKQIMSNTFNRSQILAVENVNTTFVQCVRSQLKLPHFNDKLEAIYFYPIAIRGLDYAFLTASFTSKKNGRCFSEDLTKQQKLFQEVAKIYTDII